MENCLEKGCQTVKLSDSKLSDSFGKFLLEGDYRYLVYNIVPVWVLSVQYCTGMCTHCTIMYHYGYSVNNIVQTCVHDTYKKLHFCTMENYKSLVNSLNTVLLGL